MNNEIIVLSQPAEVDMADDWYDIASLDHFWIKARFNSVLKAICIYNLNNAKLLEIGCGHGLVIKQFEALKNVVVDGCDLNMFALSKVGKIRGNLYSLDIFDNPPELLNQYDGIVLLDVIEHIDEDSRFLKESCKYLKEDGFVIINVPALNSLFSKYDKVVGHKRRYTIRMLEELFDRNGIEKIRIEYWGFFMIPIAILRKFILFFTENSIIVKRGFTPPSNTINWILTKIGLIENFLLKSPPLGTSVVAIGRYKGN
jgi:SAM-dependent methyltransferase